MSDLHTIPRQSAIKPPMSTCRIRLRPLNESDRLFLYELMTSSDSGGRVRFGGATPSPEKVLASLWESVLAQFIITCTDSGQPLGLVSITSPNFRDGFAYFSALGAPRRRVVASSLKPRCFAFTMHS